MKQPAQPTQEETIELLNSIADEEETLAESVATMVGIKARDVIYSSRKIASECRNRAQRMAAAAIA